MRQFSNRYARVRTLLVFTVPGLIAGCAGVTPPHAPAAHRVQPPQAWHASLAPGVVLDFTVQRKISEINGKSCYAFFNGTLKNTSAEILSRRRVLDFTVISQGQTLFRNIANPLQDIPPGGEGGFEFFSSPLHRDGCPDYERVDVVLR